MNYSLTAPKGVDKVITSLQGELYDILDANWAGTINGYGRVYRNKQNGSYVPEWYKGGREYVPVYYDDNFAGNFFFIVSDSHDTRDEHIFSVKVKCAFMLNLNSILPDQSERADALVHAQVVKELRKLADERYEVLGIETGIENVFNGFKTEAIGFQDMQPRHAFAIHLKLAYCLED